VPLIKGDNVMVPYFGGRLTFQVIGVAPASDAIFDTKTLFHIAEKGKIARGMLLIQCDILKMQLKR
jgi:transitional endoplasmic reticulum ATPase